MKVDTPTTPSSETPSVHERLYNLASSKRKTPNIQDGESISNDLTFSPKLMTQNYNSGMPRMDQQNVYERLYNPNYHVERDAKLAALREALASRDCTFSPTLTSPSEKRSSLFVPPTPRSSVNINFGVTPPTPRSSAIVTSNDNSSLPKVLDADDNVDEEEFNEEAFANALKAKVDQQTPSTPRSSMVTDRATPPTPRSSMVTRGAIPSMVRSPMVEGGAIPPTPRSSMIAGVGMSFTPHSSVLFTEDTLTIPQDLNSAKLDQTEENFNKTQHDEVDLLILQTMQELSILENDGVTIFDGEVKENSANISNEMNELDAEEDYAHNFEPPPDDDLDVIEAILKSEQEQLGGDSADIMAQKATLITDDFDKRSVGNSIVGSTGSNTSYVFNPSEGGSEIEEEPSLKVKDGVDKFEKE